MMKYIGAHVSISKGVENAPRNAAILGASAFAMFTKNQRQWHSAPLTPETIATFKAECKQFAYTPKQILPHDSYLINLGNPDPKKRERATKSFIDELERCRQLGLDRLNFHPGSHLRLITEHEGLALIATEVRAAIDTVPNVVAVFENTAGQGSNLGYNFEQLATMLELTNRPERVGICIDTCHAFAAGYDLSTSEGFEKTWEDFERLIGFKFLYGMHFNDSKGTLGQNLDRHESLGNGNLGMKPFEKLVTDPRFDNIPMILETPNEELWTTEIAQLQKIAGGCR